VLSSRDASLSCARRCAERAARASLFSVSVETVFARRFVELARVVRDCVDAAESAIEKEAVVAGRRAPYTATKCHQFFRDRIVSWPRAPAKANR
jgi:hypothetical protein